MEKRKFSILEQDGIEFGGPLEHETEAFDLQKEDVVTDLEILLVNQIIFLNRLTVSGTLNVKGKLGIL